MTGTVPGSLFEMDTLSHFKHMEGSKMSNEPIGPPYVPTINIFGIFTILPRIPSFHNSTFFSMSMGIWKRIISGITKTSVMEAKICAVYFLAS